LNDSDTHGLRTFIREADRCAVVDECAVCRQRFAVVEIYESERGCFMLHTVATAAPVSGGFGPSRLLKENGRHPADAARSVS